MAWWGEGGAPKGAKKGGRAGLGWARPGEQENRRSGRAREAKGQASIVLVLGGQGESGEAQGLAGVLRVVERVDVLECEGEPGSGMLKSEEAEYGKP